MNGLKASFTPSGSGVIHIIVTGSVANVTGQTASEQIYIGTGTAPNVNTLLTSVPSSTHVVAVGNLVQAGSNQNSYPFTCEATVSATNSVYGASGSAPVINADGSHTMWVDLGQLQGSASNIQVHIYELK